MNKTNILDKGSFRDPDAQVFYNQGKVYRELRPSYRQSYEHLINSGLYNKLTKANLLLPHSEIDNISGQLQYKTLLSPTIPFISYPYEWCFSQLKDAALVTLEIQQQAVNHGMSLKDASAYNIQFYCGQPILIDTSSFEIYNEKSPWVAYRQFCQHFLAPLSVMHFCDIRLSQIFRVFIDGLSLDITKSILPFRARFSPFLYMHIFLHSKTIAKYGDTSTVRGQNNTISFSKKKMLGIIDSLKSVINSLNLKKQDTEWGDYYDKTNYSDSASQHKKEIISQYIDMLKPNLLWDIGANTGLYSRLASDLGIKTISFDIDPLAVEKNYNFAKKEQNKYILPLVMDITNPTPSLGWDLEERKSLKERGGANVIMALALIHHLAISNNIPFNKIADFFAELADNIIIEFVPKEDSQVERLLANRKDIFVDYNRGSFEKIFSERYIITRNDLITGSQRILYLLRKK